MDALLNRKISFKPAHYSDQGIERNIYKDYILIFILYSFSFGLILLNQGIFWDGWVLYNQNPNDILNMFKETGFFLHWPAYLYNFLLSINQGIFLIRLLIFVTYLFTAFFLNYILSKIRIIDSLSRLFIVLIFALFNINSARIAIILLPYAICNFLFFFGFYLIVKFFFRKIILYRILSLFCFFISFSTNSFLFFYIIPFIYIFYIKKDQIIPNKISFKNFLFSLKKAYKYLDFILIPFIFFIIKIRLFEPYGLYGDYNNISLKDLNINYFIKAFNTSFLQVFKTDYIRLINYPFLIIIISVIIFLIIKKLYRSDIINFNKKNINHDLFLAGFGLFAFFAGVFPYIAVGKTPNLLDWNSRHQLLVPLGAGFILYYILKIFFRGIGLRTSIKIFFYTILITIFLCANIFIYLDYQRDWFKQLSLIENFKISKFIKNNNNFLFTDNTKDLNAIERSYRFYEWSGIMKQAFKDESRFGVNVNEKDNINNLLGLKNYPQYNFSKYNSGSKEINVIIEHGEFELSKRNIIKLFYYKFFDKKKYEDSIKKIIILEYDNKE